MTTQGITWHAVTLEPAQHAATPRFLTEAFGLTLAIGVIGDQPTTVLIAGTDADAKTQLADVGTAGGLQAVDAGSARRARELESIGVLQITLAAAEKIGWTGGLALTK